jgi:hypothetical protein
VNFTPYAFFRNVSATPKTMHFAVYYMDGWRQSGRFGNDGSQLEPAMSDACKEIIGDD